MQATTGADRRLRDERLLARLAAWLRRELLPAWDGVRFRSLERTSGGVSYETWILDADDPAAPEERTARLVLRREPLRGPLEPYDVLKEAATYRGLAGTGVPVPAVLAVCEDPQVLGRPFAVMEFVPGDVPDYRTITQRADWQDAHGRRSMATELVRVLAEVQRVDWRSFPRLAEAHGDPGSERERLHGLIDSMVAAAEHRMQTWVTLPVFRDAALWCRTHAPEGDPADMVLVHGDYKIGNFIWRDERIRAVLDWEGAMVGDPLQDLGYACHPAMREQRPDLMAMLAPLDEMVGLYEDFTGRAVDRQRLHYYVIYAMFFHTWTLLTGLPSIVEWDGDMRMATAYSKLNQVTRMLVDEIEAYEDGRGVL